MLLYIHDTRSKIMLIISMIIPSTWYSESTTHTRLPLTAVLYQVQVCCLLSMPLVQAEPQEPADCNTDLFALYLSPWQWFFSGSLILRAFRPSKATRPPKAVRAPKVLRSPKAPWIAS